MTCQNIKQARHSLLRETVSPGRLPRIVAGRALSEQRIGQSSMFL